MLLRWGPGTVATSLPANARAEKPCVDNGLLSREWYELPPEACHLFSARQPVLQGEAGSHCPGAAAACAVCRGRWVRPQGLLPRRWAALPEHWGCGYAPGFPARSPIAPPTLSSRNAKQMPAAVAEALQSVLQLEGGLSPSEAEEHLAALERSQRFQSETWS